MKVKHILRYERETGKSFFDLGKLIDTNAENLTFSQQMEIHWLDALEKGEDVSFENFVGQREEKSIEEYISSFEQKEEEGNK